MKILLAIVCGRYQLVAVSLIERVQQGQGFTWPLDDQEGKLKNNSGGGGDVGVELMLVLSQEIRKRKVYVVVRERAV